MNVADTTVAKLRTLVAGLETEITASSNPELRKQWDAFVGVLALGDAPSMRDCPTCKVPGMSAASRCSNCWSALVPAA
jgi:hypothetical protein